MIFAVRGLFKRPPIGPHLQCRRLVGNPGSIAGDPGPAQGASIEFPTVAHCSAVCICVRDGYRRFSRQLRRSSDSQSGASVALPHGLDPDTDTDPFPSTYKPLPSEPTAIVGAHIFTGTGSEIAAGHDPDPRRQDRSRRREPRRAGGLPDDRRSRRMGDARPDRCAFAYGRLRRARSAGAFRRQRSDRSQHGAGLGRTFRVAAGSRRSTPRAAAA